MNTTEAQARLERRRRRQFIRAHHPDVGGNPEVFRRGLQALGESVPGMPPVRVVAIRSQRMPLAAVLRFWQRRVAPRVH